MPHHTRQRWLTYRRRWAAGDLFLGPYTVGTMIQELSVRVRKAAGAAPALASERAEVEAMLRRIEELRRAATRRFAAPWPVGKTLSDVVSRVVSARKPPTAADDLRRIARRSRWFRSLGAWLRAAWRG